MRIQFLSALVLGLAASHAAAQSLMQQYGEIVQGSGDAIPGLTGVTLAASSATSIPNMDLNGNIVWRGTMLVGSGTPAVTTGNDQAIFYGRNGADLQILLREGDPEPSLTMPGVTISYSAVSWDVVRLSPENGYMLFNTTLVGTGGTTNDTCVYSGLVGSSPLQILVREGDIAPGGATISNNLSGALGSSGINSAGICVVRAHVTPGTGDAISGVNDDGLLYGVAGGPLVWCIREGDPINGGAQAVGTLDSFNFSIDLLGRVLVTQPLSTTLGTTPATTADDMTMMLYTPGSGVSLVWREGDSAPDANPPLLEGCDYDTVGSSAQSKVAMSRLTGQVVFTQNLKNGNVTGSTNNTAIFAGTLGGSFTRIAREGEAAPTGVPGEIYQAIFTSGQPAINENGTVVFVAQLGPTGLDVHQDVAVFLAKPPYNANTDVQMILREGQPVAGLPAGWIVDNTSGGGMSSSGTTLMLNDRDAVLINVAGVGDNTQPNWGIPATIGWDPQHGARAFYVQGDTFTVAGSPWSTTSAANWNIFSSGDGCSLQFNNNGDVCAKLFNGSQNAIARCHLGSMISEPASVPITGGVPQNFHIDCGPGLAFNFYIVLASGIGSRPGVPNPLNFGLTIPLNVGGSPDWFTLSFNLANSPVWGNTLFFTDANGQATANFTMPAGYPMFQGVTLHHAAVLFDFALFSPYVTEPSNLRLY
ncbi:MAG: hypothetical protein JNL08_12975 [Planctomycetes bacterium]|nr:hypothetical protein [Planctomycetota bacterium]